MKKPRSAKTEFQRIIPYPTNHCLSNDIWNGVGIQVWQQIGPWSDQLIVDAVEKQLEDVPW